MDVVAFGFWGFADGLLGGGAGGEVGEHSCEAVDHVVWAAAGVDDPGDLDGIAFEVVLRGDVEVGIEEGDAGVGVAGHGDEGEHVADFGGFAGEDAHGFHGLDAEVEEGGLVGGAGDGGVEFEEGEGVVGEEGVEGVGGLRRCGEGEEEDEGTCEFHGG